MVVVPKILFVLTSFSYIESINRTVGWYLVSLTYDDCSTIWSGSNKRLTHHEKSAA